MMRAGRALLRRGLGGDAGEVGVDLPGIGIDDLRIQRLGQLDGGRRLAAARGPGKADDGQGRAHALSGRRKPPKGAERQGVPCRTSPRALFSSRRSRTFSGTSPWMSAPWLAAALTMVELMNSHW